jgi:hypothetical protein
VKNFERIKSNSSVLNKQRVTMYRSCLGSLAFLLHTRLDLRFAISFFGKFSYQPTEEAWRVLFVVVTIYSASWLS